jgi:benzoyl-CoA reductase/2-hydroxyglutaryl-CoA dehydratase subunit BcrC/BadD/HgdB
MESLAECYTQIYLNIDIEIMVNEIKGLISRYNADGFVLHSNRSCKPYSLGQYDIARMIQEDTGIPTLIIEADMTDDRVYSEAQAKTRIEAFIETLESNRK